MFGTSKQSEGQPEGAVYMNAAQRKTASDYSGNVVSVSRKSGEYDNERDPVADGGGYAVVVRFSTGWVVTIGRYGAVLREVAPSKQTGSGSDKSKRIAQLAEAIAEYRRMASEPPLWMVLELAELKREVTP